MGGKSYAEIQAQVKGGVQPPQPTALALRPPTEPEKLLEYLSELNKAIEQAEDISYTLSLKDRAEAGRFLMRKLRLGRDARNRASESIIKAERRLGELLLATDKNTGGNPNWLHDATGRPLTYEEMGFDKYAARRWQLLARVDPKELDLFIAERLEERAELTSASAYTFAQAQIGGEGQTFHPPDFTLDNDAGRVLWDLVGLLNRAGRLVIKGWWK